MIFTDITISNFFSITNEINLPLLNQGLVLIAGENHDSSAADSNGSGKSALIIESIVWCLWGKTVRGESGDSVINRKTKKDCYVYLTLMDGAKPYTIKRFRNHSQYKNGLQLWSGATDLSEGTATLTQDKIDELLSIDFDSFIRGPMMPQGSFKRFSQMTDSEQKSILENSCQLHLFPAALERTKTRINEEVLARQAMDVQLEQSRSRLRIDNEDLKRLQEEKKNLQHQRALQKAEQLRNIHWAICEYDWAWDHWQPTVDTTNYSAVLQRVTTLEQELINKWNDTLAAAQHQEQETNVGLRTLQNEAKRLEADISKLENLKPDGRCPVCFQQISQAKRYTCLVEFKSLLNLCKSKVADASKEYNSAVSHRQQVQKDKQESLDRAELIKDKAASDLEVVQQAHKYNTNMESMINTAWAAVSSRSSKLKEFTPLDRLIEEKIKLIIELEKSVDALLVDITQTDTLLEHLNFWKTGFSNAGLKSKILNSITPFLNRQVDTYIRDLTDGELTVVFNTQTQLKSGQTREQFSVEVANKNGAVTYDGSSGGEKARADLAITLALSDLVASRSKKSYLQRWFDEPFESMDEAGVEAVMEMLAKMVPAAGSIFVITHQVSMKSLFNKVVTIVKRNGSSRIVNL